MVIDVVTSRERNPVEQRLHVGERTDRHAAFADFALGQLVVGVVAHQRRQIEGHRKTGLSLRQQVAEARVGVFGRAEAGELAHGPEALAIHRRVNAARVGRLAGHAEIAIRIPPGQVGVGVETPNRVAGDGGEFSGALGRFCERGLQNCFFPRVLGRA